MLLSSDPKAFLPEPERGLSGNAAQRLKGVGVLAKLGI
jgi:hypothetical protein